jgi:hypothetical protein
MKRALSAAVLAANLLAAGCGSSSSPVAASPAPTQTTPSVMAAIFSFSEDFASLTSAGATAQATIVGVLANGFTRDITSTCTNWQSSDTAVLSVSSTGLLTAHASNGAALVTTTCQTLLAGVLITLNPTPAPLVLIYPPPAAASSCPRPPYNVTVDYNGRKHCRETSTGRFALDLCCGI